MRGERPNRLLLVEDDDELAGLLTETLVYEGFVVDRAADGQRGLHLGLTRTYDVLVIDRKLPALDGLDLVARLRSRRIPARALMLTALGTVGDRIAGLDAGADDYLMKPFDLDELSARIRALCRRTSESANVLRIGAGRLDLTPATRCWPTAPGWRCRPASSSCCACWRRSPAPCTPGPSCVAGSSTRPPPRR